MKITIFTSNQSRHVSLISSLANVADEVFAVQEVTTLFPGVRDDFYKKTAVMEEYFRHVVDAEKEVFGSPTFLPENVHQLSCKMGDLSHLSMSALGPALEADLFVVFGSSYIRGPLCDFLVSKNAVNIHMGVSPYYRGHSCNFWALNDHNPEYVGATVHMLSSGLDSGNMLFHAFPKSVGSNLFSLGMNAVKAAHDGLCSKISDGTLFSFSTEKQNKTQQIRYSKGVEFTDEVAEAYLARDVNLYEVQSKLDSRQLELFLKSYVG